MAWNFHFDFLASKLRKANGILVKLPCFTPEPILKCLYYALFHFHMSYATIVWGQCLTQNSRIGKLQKRCLRILIFSNFDTETSQLFVNTRIPTLQKTVFRSNIKLVHETLNNVSPQALQDTLAFKTISHPHQYQTRSSNLKLLERPKAKTLNYGLNSLNTSHF